VNEHTMQQGSGVGPEWNRVIVIPPEKERAPFKSGIYDTHIDMFGHPIFKAIMPSGEPIIDVGGLAQELLKDMQLFMSNRSKYLKLKLPHKRGYLMHGDPGCGKTSMIRLVQRLFVEKFGGTVLHIRHVSCSQFYDEVHKVDPMMPIMFVIEDLDNYLSSFEPQLLEFLDGAESLDNVILLATTNYLQNVPDRVRSRPSRIDRLFAVAKPNTEERQIYLAGLGATGEYLSTLVSYSEGMSFAQAKELFIGTAIFGNSINEVAERLKNLPDEALMEEDEADEDYPGQGKVAVSPTDLR